MNTEEDPPRNLGPQPLAEVLEQRGVSPHDLVEASTEQITHKMVSRAIKGRRLTANTMRKVHRAWQRAAESELPVDALFSYRP